jgi:hypothetical protein
VKRGSFEAESNEPDEILSVGEDHSAIVSTTIVVGGVEGTPLLPHPSRPKTFLAGVEEAMFAGYFCCDG